MEDYREVFVGIDAAKARNAIALAEAGRAGEIRFVGEVDASVESMRRIVKRIAGKYRRSHFCYEAGPTGYGLHRLISSLGHECTVVALSLIPGKPGDQVKINRRDAVALARLFRAGELTAVWVPVEGHEAIRDLVRARTAAVETLRKHRQQVSALMLKHGRSFPGKKTWTMRYLRWLQEQAFDHIAHQIALQEMVDAVRLSNERVVRIEGAIEEFVPQWTLAPLVQAVQSLRGVSLIVAVTFVTEIGDLSRFENPRQLMGYLGLVPSERSNGNIIRRGGDHQSWQQPSPNAVGRECLGISVCPSRRSQEALQPAKGQSQGSGDRLEGPIAPYGPLSQARRAREKEYSHLYRDCEQTGCIHVGTRPGGAKAINHRPLETCLCALLEAELPCGNSRFALCGRHRPMPAVT